MKNKQQTIIIVLTVLALLFGNGVVFTLYDRINDNSETSFQISNLEDSDETDYYIDNTTTYSETSKSNNSEDELDSHDTTSSIISNNWLDEDSSIDSNTSTGDSPAEEEEMVISFNEVNVISEVPNLTILDINYDYFLDEFSYEVPSENILCEFERGIYVNLTLFPEISKEEFDRHTGEIMLLVGDECYENYDISAKFFAANTGLFVVEFPSNMPAGDYKYVAKMYINGELLETQVLFTVYYRLMS